MIDLMEIVNPLIEEFLRRVLPARDGILAELEVIAEKDKVPIIKPEVAQLLSFLVKLHKPKKILEVGTAIGYSTLWLANAMKSNLETSGTSEIKLVSVEKDNQRFEEAKHNLDQEGFEFVHLVHGDALEVLPQIEGSFDFIFIDAAKGQYLNFFDLCYPLLNLGGIMVADNVLFRGLVSSSEVDRRYKTMIKRIKGYLDLVSNHSELETTILPIGDGVAISFKKR